MFIEPFLSDTHRRAELQKALSILNSIGFFQVMLEMSYERSGFANLGSPTILEAATFQRGFSLGYYQSIQDIFNFQETFTKIVQGEKQVEPDWGAKQVLLGKGLTHQEINDAKLKRTREPS